MKRLKIISMGDLACGKSTIIKRFCENRFISKYLATIGIDYGIKSVNVAGMELKISFFDLSGSNDFLEVRNEFYSDTQGAVLVFDVTNRCSFDNLSLWLAEASKFNAPKNMAIFVCGNKIDKTNRVVSELEASQWCDQHNLRYFETSAANGRNINSCFMSLFSAILNS
ncbi:hypothetical protein GEMRC1_001873 [Eukaryota sp. GEM-RC1]